jgi:hypothetical protein
MLSSYTNKLASLNKRRVSYYTSSSDASTVALLFCLPHIECHINALWGATAHKGTTQGKPRESKEKQCAPTQKKKKKKNQVTLEKSSVHGAS